MWTQCREQVEALVSGKEDLDGITVQERLLLVLYDKRPCSAPLPSPERQWTICRQKRVCPLRCYYFCSLKLTWNSTNLLTKKTIQNHFLYFFQLISPFLSIVIHCFFSLVFIQQWWSFLIWLTSILYCGMASLPSRYCWFVTVIKKKKCVHNTVQIWTSNHHPQL